MESIKKFKQKRKNLRRDNKRFYRRPVQNESIIPDFEKDDEVEQARKLLEDVQKVYKEPISGFEWAVSQKEVDGEIEYSVFYNGDLLFTANNAGDSVMNSVQIMDEKALASAVLNLLGDLSSPVDTDNEQEKLETEVKEGLDRLLDLDLP